MDLLALAATLTLAVCIGANTTVFSVANSILIRPLPYPGSDRIDWISERSGPVKRDVGAAPDYFALREQNRIFADVAAMGSLLPTTVNWTGVERPEQLGAASVSPSFFHVMGTQPLMGRYFTPEEEGPKAAPVAVLSYAFWRNRLGRRSAYTGKNHCAGPPAAHYRGRDAARVRFSARLAALGAYHRRQNDGRFSDLAHTREFSLSSWSRGASLT